MARDILIDPSTTTRLSTHWKLILPKAPIIPFTVYSDQPNGGARPVWFNINDWRDLNYLEEEDELMRSCIHVEQVRESKMQMNKTIIAGFSQGYHSCFQLFPGSIDQLPSTGFTGLHEVLTYNAANTGLNFLRRISQEAFERAKFKTIAGLAHGFWENEQIAVTNWIEGIVDQDTTGEFDDSLDNLDQPENELDDPQHPVQHSISFSVCLG
ncbi:uncharacterized protein MELLADRAFT_86059 [Melampsora larici-populina 98AG31]|uniref:Phospholipase/carboxylesterase/thioesterase domain-containing protein n=1 Tax=Melampsora larici-populina (strain 98AG31 / pathotype 3-4-7) TaxID=747676 RepID=F4RKM2_MELLP|nr:uncharacterized protein MELLADRAFT_86059 [Melampsora larici-populina 98AG31]EGG07116.1 hypothetical protein MELLADRAFT_86059 [Melampsora larici-populina 98AG31]